MQRVVAGSCSKASVVLSLFSSGKSCFRVSLTSAFPKTKRGFTRFKVEPLCTATATTTAPVPEVEQDKRSILLERLRTRHLKETLETPLNPFKNGSESKSGTGDGLVRKGKIGKKVLAKSFGELGLTDEVMGAVRELGIDVPTEIQCIGIPAVLEGKSVVLGSHTGSGKTLAYLLPLVQLMREDEAHSGVLMKPKRPRAIVLCPTRELSEQVFRVAKSLSHHARFRSILVSGGGRLRPQEDSLSCPIDLIVGTPGRILQHIEDGNMVYGDIKYLVLDEADTMFDHGFGPDIRKFIKPLNNRSLKSGDNGYQTVLVTATMTPAVKKLIDEEFQGITHLCTSSLHKKINTCNHNFIKLSSSENKLEALLQVLEPSLAKGNRVMVFCNTLDSSRAVDHFLAENQISTVNYHGEVPAEKRVENLEKFKSDDGDCPTLVCTDLAARGLDFNVDHVIIFDFPSHSIDYIHRAGRTARMGAKGKVTSLVTKRDLLLADQIEKALLKNENLDSFSLNGLRRDNARSKVSTSQARKPFVLRSKTTDEIDKSSSLRGKAASKMKIGKIPLDKTKKTVTVSKAGRGGLERTSQTKSPKAAFVSKDTKFQNLRSANKGAKRAVNDADGETSSQSRRGRSSARTASVAKTTSRSFKSVKIVKPSTQKLRVVSFRGRSSLDNKGLGSR